MPTVKIRREILLKALQEHLKKATWGITDSEITEIRGVIKSGEAFEIDHVEVTAHQLRPSARTVDLSGASVTPIKQTAGKLRLATVDGVPA